MNASETAPSYYAQIGGAPTIREAVERFYKLVLSDVELGPYFADVDMARLKRHQAQLLTTVLGGPNDYAGRDLAVAHADRGITGPHYTKVANYLVDVLRDLGAPEHVVTAVSTTVDSVRDQVVGSSPGQPSDGGAH